MALCQKANSNNLGKYFRFSTQKSEVKKTQNVCVKLVERQFRRIRICLYVEIIQEKQGHFFLVHLHGLFLKETLGQSILKRNLRSRSTKFNRLVCMSQ